MIMWLPFLDLKENIPDYYETDEFMVDVDEEREFKGEVENESILCS